MLMNELLKEIKQEIEDKEIMERMVQMAEKYKDEEILNYCKRLLNKLEYTLVNDMSYYVNVYKENEERNYGPRLNTEE